MDVHIPLWLVYTLKGIAWVVGIGAVGAVLFILLWSVLVWLMAKSIAGARYR